MTLKRVPEWDILDSSKIQSYMRCPRKYFFNHILGWSLEEEEQGALEISSSGLLAAPKSEIRKSEHLVFGTAWHHSMEHLLRENRKAGMPKGYTIQSVP